MSAPKPSPVDPAAARAPHGVLFNLGADRIVCQCGMDYATMPGIADAVALWARHIRALTGVQPYTTPQPEPEPEDGPDSDGADRTEP